MIKRLLPLIALSFISGCGYFDEDMVHRILGQKSEPSEPTIPSDPANPVDRSTLAFFRFEEKDGATLLDETGRSSGTLVGATRVAGYQGQGIRLGAEGYAAFDSILPDHTANGTLELHMQTAPGWSSTATYSIFGNRGSRLHLIYIGGVLYFQKNHDDVHKFVGAPIDFVPGKWYRIAATWGQKGMRLLVDGKLVASNDDRSDYQRPPVVGWAGHELFFAGHKEWCCMEGIGIFDRSLSYHFDGVIDELQISSVERY